MPCPRYPPIICAATWDTGKTWENYTQIAERFSWTQSQQEILRYSEDIFLFGPSSGAVATLQNAAGDTWESSDEPSRDAQGVINERPAELRTSELAENGKSPLNCR